MRLVFSENASAWECGSVAVRQDGGEGGPAPVQDTNDRLNLEAVGREHKGLAFFWENRLKSWQKPQRQMFSASAFHLLQSFNHR